MGPFRHASSRPPSRPVQGMHDSQLFDDVIDFGLATNSSYAGNVSIQDQDSYIE